MNSNAQNCINFSNNKGLSPNNNINNNAINNNINQNMNMNGTNSNQMISTEQIPKMISNNNEIKIQENNSQNNNSLGNNINNYNNENSNINMKNNNLDTNQISNEQKDNNKNSFDNNNLNNKNIPNLNMTQNNKIKENINPNNEISHNNLSNNNDNLPNKTLEANNKEQNNHSMNNNNINKENTSQININDNSLNDNRKDNNNNDISNNKPVEKKDIISNEIKIEIKSKNESKKIDNININKNTKGAQNIFGPSYFNNIKKMASEEMEKNKRKAKEKEKAKKDEENILLPSSLSLDEISSISNQMMKSIFMIEFEDKTCTGCLVKISIKNRSIFCLLTSNEILNDNFINNNKEINVFFNNGKVVKKIEISDEKIKYVNNPYNVALIEINEDNEFNDYLNIDEVLFDDNENSNENSINEDKVEGDYPKDYYRNKFIYIPYYQNKKIFVSFGLLKDFNEFEIIHFCKINNDNSGPSGAPIINLENQAIIGIYNNEKKSESKRFGIFLEQAAKEFVDKCSNNIIDNENNLLRYSISQEIFDNNMNLIKLKLNVDEDMLNKEVYFLDNHFEHNHLKELKEKNVELEINGEKVKYKKSFIPKKCENEILIHFKKPLRDCSYMFYASKYIIDIDLSLFDTKSVTNMEYMFAFCENLIYIDLSYLDTKKVNDISNMFFYCFNLEKIKLCYLGNENTVMENIFFGCKKCNTLDLSKLKVEDDFNINMDNEIIKTIIIRKELKDKFKNCSLNIKYI
jgi:surface protein